MFSVYVAALKDLELAKAIHLSQAYLITAIQQEKAPTKIFLEYSGYTDIFTSDLAIELHENTGINKYAIDLNEDNQPP